MSTESEDRPDDVRSDTPAESGASDGSGAPGWSRAGKVWAAVVGVMLVLWFFFAWLVLDRHVIDAAGESVGTAFALGIAVSLVGVLRGSR